MKPGDRVKVRSGMPTWGGLEGVVIDQKGIGVSFSYPDAVLFQTDNGSMISMREQNLEVVAVCETGAERVRKVKRLARLGRR